MRFISFDLKKEFDDVHEEQINKGIDAITERYNLEYMFSGHYKFPKDSDEEDIIRRIENDLENDQFLKEYIQISAWKQTEK